MPKRPGPGNKKKSAGAAKSGSKRSKPVPASPPRRSATKKTVNISRTELERLLEKVEELRIHQIELETQNEELRMAQQLIEASRCRYADLYDSAPVGYFSFDSKCLIVDVNLTGAVLLRRDKNTLLSKPFFLFIEPQDRRVFEEHARAVLSTGVRQSCELRLLTGDGLSFHAYLESVTDEKGVIIRTTITDITARKNAEEALRQSEERFRVAQDLSLDAFTILTAIRGTDGAIEDFQWHYVNPKAGTYLRHSPEYLVGRRLLQVLPGNQTDSDLFNRYVRVVETGEPHEYELRYEADGISGWFRNMAVKLGDGIAIYFSDITGRKRNEERMRQQEELYRTLAENSPDFIARHDRQYRHIYVNSKIAAFEGRKQEDFVGKTLEDMGFPLDIANTWNGIFQRVFETGQEESIEFAFPGPDGVRYIHRTLVPEFGPDGSVQTVLAIGRDITERKRAEEALRQATTRLEAHMQNSPLAIIEFDADFRPIRWSEAAERMFGWKADEIVGRSTAEVHFVHEDDKALIAEVWQGLLTGGNPRNLTVNRNYRKDGSVVYCEWYNSAIHDDQGRLKSVLSQVLDITERKQAENALRESNERFQRLVEQSQDGIIIIDQEGTVIEWNHGQENITGIPRSEALGRPLWEMQARLAPERLQSVAYESSRDRVTKALQEGIALRRVVEEEIRKPDGAQAYVQSVVFTIDTSRGRFAVGIMRDITERKRAEEALRDSEERNGSLLKFTPLGMLLIRDTAITWVNPSAVRLWGAWNEQELLTRSPSDLFHPSSHDLLESHAQGLRKGLPVETREEKIVTFDGTLRDVEVTAVPFVDDRGSSVLVMLNDITRRKRAEAELQQSEARLRALFENAGDAIFVLQAEGEFAGSILATNKAAADMHGYTLAELKNMHIGDLDGPDDASQVPDRLQRIMKGEWIKAELMHRRKNGSMFPVEISVGLITSGKQKFILAFDRDISSRKAAEEAVRESREQYLRLFNTVNDGIVFHPLKTDTDPGRFTMVNETICRMLGYSEEEMRSLTPHDIILPVEVPDTVNNREILRYQGHHIHKKTLVTRSGGHIPVEISSRVFEQDGVLMALSVIRDNTERNTAEDRIQHQHALLNAINLIFREALNIDSEDELLKICLAAAETVTKSKFGFINELEQDGLLHMRVYSDTGWNLCAMQNKFELKANGVFKLQGIYLRAIHGKRPYFTNDPASDPHRVGLPPGHPPLTAFLGVPLISRGKVIGMIGLANREGGYRPEDVESLDALAVATVQVLMNKRVGMEIKRLNQDLRRRVSELQTIFDTAPLGLCLAYDPEGKHIRGNPALNRFLGSVEGAELSKVAEQQSYRVLQNDRELPVQELPMQRAVRGETVSGMIVDIERTDRTLVKLYCSATPLLDEEGRPRGAVGAFLDITSMIRAEDEIAKLNRELKQNLVNLRATNRELEAFVYSVSHDLRAPLRSIKGFSDFLLQDYADLLDERGKGYLDRVVKNTGKMDHIIDDLLHLSRISRQQLDRVDMDLSQVVSAHLAELANAAPERTVAVEVSQGLHAKADPRLIRVALGNLLNNAWKFSAKMESPRIEFGMSNKNGEEVYFIRDNGAGFDEAFSSKLFLPFHRLHSEHEFEGSGIGLAIVERVIRKHGGRVWAQGKPNEGACFYFTLG